jgi:hypothetical protein
VKLQSWVTALGEQGMEAEPGRLGVFRRTHFQVRRPRESSYHPPNLQCLVADCSKQISCTIVGQRDLEIRVKITSIETYPVWGGERNLLFVVVDTDEGIYGVGEAGLTGRELAVTGTIEHFEPLLLGKDPFRTEHLWQLLSRGGFFPARHAVSAAISAVDIALWDIKGKALGVPVYELLGRRR